MAAELPRELTIEDIVAALHLTLADLFPENKAKSKPRTVAPTTTKVPTARCYFSQYAWSPKASGHSERAPGLIWNVEGMALVLYRLPELKGTSRCTSPTARRMLIGLVGKATENQSHSCATTAQSNMGVEN